MSHLEDELLGRFAGRLTTPEEERRVDAHLAECEECRNAFSSYRTFARSLDEEWLRRTLQEALPDTLGCPEPEELSTYASGLVLDDSRQTALAAHLNACADCSGLVREIEDTAERLKAADPLASSTLRRGWMTVFRELLTFWPARFALAGGAACALVLGLVLGWTLSERPGGPVAMVPPIPPYEAGPTLGLGIAPDVKPEAHRRFREAMAFYGAPDFAHRAFPLLQEAVALDPSHDQAQFWLGAVLLLEGKAQEAIAPLETAIKLAPGSAIYKQYLAWAYLKTGAVDRALVLQTELLKRP